MPPDGLETATDWFCRFPLRPPGSHTGRTDQRPRLSHGAARRANWKR